MPMLLLQGMWCCAMHRPVAWTGSLPISVHLLWLLLLGLVRPIVYRLPDGRFRQGDGGMHKVFQVLSVWLCFVRSRLLRWHLQLHRSSQSHLQHRHQGLCWSYQEHWVHRQQDQISPRPINGKRTFEVDGHLHPMIHAYLLHFINAYSFSSALA